MWIKNTFAPDDYGTKVTTEIDKSAEDERENIVREFKSINNISLLSLEGGGMVVSPVFEEIVRRSEFGADKCNFITQSSSEHSICVTIDSNDTVKTKKAVDKVFEDEILLKK